MIIGIGTDMVNIRRIADVLARHGDRFVDRCFSAGEKHRVEMLSRGDDALRAAGYAKRWAAKEACAKALSIGIRDGVFLRDISVENDQMGKPSLKLTGGALAQLEKLAGPGRAVSVNLSLSDEAPMALAFVVISLLPSDMVTSR